MNIWLVVADEGEIPFGADNGFVSKIIVTGIGCSKTIENLGVELEKEVPDMIICFGLCGSVNRNLKVGNTVIATQVRYRKPGTLMTQRLDIDTTRIFPRTINLKKGVEKGVFQTFHGMVRHRFGISRGVVAVDQETYHVTALAKKYNVPVLVAKVVSDRVPFIPTTVNKQFRKLKVNYKYAKGSLNLLWLYVVQKIKTCPTK
ncbi:hypothetical protein HN858_01665 [Candidatus Falkowbacteria bacterium]|jgi:purine-nucleoside phosphorylase|nr:hypothetical protein [Candidatus Falkowbacteria bacterium]MBT5503760.1 hypothetical protein [Candidatus Falkowbacteria bacterium]MBT6573951.1 hypothetical protein [Candidatus Falkowbacteria bacterium]MBT7348361.1 hypothetical protein [Candidatus Falkowbacteria bacterium]MBT7500254.1 hypothetical protein [Candidatus Falkowbacteria bacterium]